MGCNDGHAEKPATGSLTCTQTSVIGVTGKLVIRDTETYRYTYLWTILSTDRRKIRAEIPEYASGKQASLGWNQG